MDEKIYNPHKFKLMIQFQQLKDLSTN